MKKTFYKSTQIGYFNAGTLVLAFTLWGCDASFIPFSCIGTGFRF